MTMGKITKFSSETVKSIVRLPVFLEIRKKIVFSGAIQYNRF